MVGCISWAVDNTSDITIAYQALGGDAESGHPGVEISRQSARPLIPRWVKFRMVLAGS